MGGFLSALAGAGQAAGPYRENVLNRWQESRNALAQMISTAREDALDQEHHNALLQLEQKLRTAKPGTDLSKVGENLHQLLVVHPATVSSMEQHGLLTPIEKPTSKPGPAPPGQVPGTPVIQPPSDGGSGNGNGNVNGNPLIPQNPLAKLMGMGGGGGDSSAPTAQAATSPIQPQAQSHALQLPPAPSTSSIPKNPIVEKYEQVLQSGGFMPHGLKMAAAPYIQGQASNEAELNRQEQLLRFQREQGMRNLQALEGMGIKVPDWQKVSIMTGVSMPGMAGLMRPMTAPAPTQGNNAPPDTTDAFGHPIDPKGMYRVRQYPMSGETEWIPISTTNAQVTTPEGNVATFNRYNPGAGLTPIQGAVAPSMVTPHTVTTPNGQTAFQSAAGAKNGTAPTPTGGINTAMLPTVSNGFRTVQTLDENGNPVTRLEPVTTSSQKVARGGGSLTAPVPAAPAGSAASSPGAGAAAPAAAGNAPSRPSATAHGAKEFIKPLTPEQAITQEQKLGQLNLAIDRAESIKKKLPMLNSMLEAGKLNLETDSGGIVRALLNRAMPMSPEEEQFAGDFRTLMEDINLLRGPLGATGFRGPEAWAALQGQRGQLLAKPGITAQVLTNTLQALRRQAVPLARRPELKGAFKEGEMAGGKAGSAGGSGVITWTRDAQGNPVPVK